ncbi:MAG: hypothetical protein WCO69_05120 [Candidatus Omnitrophota bacterium]
MFYNRTRTFSPGDVLLFRPLLFLMLYLQKMIFGYAFFWWQLTALGAHLFSVWALWRLLRRWAGDHAGSQAAAWLFTIFFAFLFANTEAVIWHGITPYVFFAGFILMALDQLETHLLSAGHDQRSLNTCAGWLLAAVLIYEAGIWYIPCLFLYAFLSLKGSGREQKSLILLVPILIYAGWDIGHWLITACHFDAETSRIAGTLPGLKTLMNFGSVAKWFIAGGFFLQPQDIIPISRLMVRPDVFRWDWPLANADPARWIGAAALIATAASAGISMLKCRKETMSAKALLLTAMLAGYVLIIVAGRANVREDGSGLHRSLYYFYNFWVLFTPLLFLVTRPLFNKHRLLAGALSITLLCLAVQGSWNISRICTTIAEDQRPSRLLIKLLEGFIAQHRQEKDLSFYIRPNEPGNYWVNWLIKKNDPPGKHYYFVDVLYPQYTDPLHPKYRLQGIVQ